MKVRWERPWIMDIARSAPFEASQVRCTLRGAAPHIQFLAGLGGRAGKAGQSIYNLCHYRNCCAAVRLRKSMCLVWSNTSCHCYYRTCCGNPWLNESSPILLNHPCNHNGLPQQVHCCPVKELQCRETFNWIACILTNLPLQAETALQYLSPSHLLRGPMGRLTRFSIQVHFRTFWHHHS